MKVLSFLFSLILAFSMVLGGAPGFESRPASAQSERPEITNNPKVNPELHLRVTVKQSLQGRAEPSDRLIEEIYPAFTDPEELVSELVYVYMDEPPTESQLEEMKSLGMIPYPETWVPPVGQHPQGFFLTDMPVDRLEQLAAKEYITRLDTAERQVFPQNDVAGGVMNLEPVWTSGYDGTGVTVAVIDSSLDFNYSNTNDRHPDIPATAIVKDYSAYPSLDNEVRSTVTGHGTHVAASALGRGVGDLYYRGTALGADLVFLKVGNDQNASATMAAMVAAIVEAVDVYQADIINVSYGGWSVFHDGSDAKCQAVDYAVSQGATVFTSAGNEATRGLHVTGTVSAQSYTLHWFYLDQSCPFSFNMVWNDSQGTNEDLFLIIQDGLGNFLAPEIIQYGCGTSPRDTHAFIMETYNGGWHNLSPGWYGLVVLNYTDTPKEYHIYSNISSIPGTFEYPDPYYTLISPAEADSAIAVGAYVSRWGWSDSSDTWHTYGDLLDEWSVADFSSRGPRVDQAAGAPQIPSFVAPGAGIVSARHRGAADVNDPTRIIDTAGYYYLMQGTSMASPLAAGVGALLKQKNPSWTPAQIRHAMETTTQAGYPGSDRNINGWGLLKADAAAAATLPAWLPYADASCTVPASVFSVPGAIAANMKGSGFLPAHQYGVAFYDGAGNLAGSQLATTTQAGELTTAFPFTGSEATGDWQTIVFQNYRIGETETWVNPPATLTEGWSYLITTGTFTVSEPPEPVSISAIPGVEAPAVGSIPVSVITSTDQFTGTVAWSPADNPFMPSTVYTATINLAAEPGYTFEGVPADFFTVEGATATNPVNSGVVTAVFPATGYDPSIGVISGQVTDNGTGNPVVGAVVVALNNSTYTFDGSDATDANGYYVIPVPDGVYAVRVQPDVYPMTYNKELVTISDHSIVTDVNFSLKPGATISGTVTDADTGAGIEGVQVHAFDYGIDWGVPPVMTDINGTYNIIVSEGTYRIWAQPAPEYASQYYDCTDYENATLVSILAGETKTKIDFALELLSAFITGEIRSADGEILAGVTVTLESKPPVTSDAQGIYRIEVTSPGTYTVTASLAGYRDTSLEVTVTDLNEDVALHFRGNTGLVPNAPDLSYVLACINRWQFPPDGVLGLGMDKVLTVISAWKNPQQP